MPQNILLTFFRVTVRHPLYAALNLLGLSFGIAVFVTLSLYARFETSFESWLPHADELYQVYTRWTLPGRPEAMDPQTMGGLLDQLHEDYPDLLGTRMFGMQASVALAADVFHENEQLVDPEFFKLFDLPFLAGEPADALVSPDKIVITEELARKYFGRSDAVGETIRLADFQGTHPYVVSGVVKTLPRNTDFDLGFIRLLTPEAAATQKYWSHWGSSQVRTFLRIATRAQAASLAAQMDAFADRKSNNAPPGGQHTEETLRLVPLKRAHLIDAQTESAVVTLGLVGLAAFVIAAINFINLSTARAGMRAREVAVRRTLGATRTALRVQFLGEASLMTLIASLAGLALVELTLPILNAAGGLALSLDYRHQGPFLLALLGGVLALGLLSGLYPAFVLSGFQPAQVLASSRAPSGGRLGIRVRELLVVVQFAVVIAFFILTWGFDRQMDHMRTSDLGFRRQGLLLVPSTYDSAVTPAMLRSLLTAFRQVPGVSLVSNSDSAPGNDNMRNFTSPTLPDGSGRKINVMYVQVGPDFFQTYGAHLLAGRLFDASRQADETPVNLNLDEAVPWNVVISERMLAAFGFATPEAAIDQSLHLGSYSMRIIGVVDELRFHSQKERLPPTFYYFNRAATDNQIAAIRYDGVPEAEMRARLAEVWRSVAGGIPFEIVSAEDNLDRYYRSDRNRARLVSVAAVVAALVGCIGLYGMAAFTTSRRLLEVAVRKVLGASSKALVALLVGSFLRPVLLANLIAGPVGFFMLTTWLTQFNDRIAVTPVPFLIGGGGAILVAAATVGTLAWNAANSEPGRALRHE